MQSSGQRKATWKTERVPGLKTERACAHFVQGACILQDTGNRGIYVSSQCRGVGDLYESVCIARETIFYGAHALDWSVHMTENEQASLNYWLTYRIGDEDLIRERGLYMRTHRRPIDLIIVLPTCKYKQNGHLLHSTQLLLFRHSQLPCAAKLELGPLSMKILLMRTQIPKQHPRCLAPQTLPTDVQVHKKSSSTSKCARMQPLPCPPCIHPSTRHHH